LGGDFYKAWLLRRVSADVVHGKAAFWQARDVQQGIQALASVERSAVLLPLAQANQQLMPGTLGAQGDVSAQRTRVLRDALHGVLHRLQSGQVLLATVGSTAPFVGLLGTVWGFITRSPALPQRGSSRLSVWQVLWARLW